MATYQMLWDCRQCGTEKLLGVDHRFCPTCGAPQDPESRYFPSERDKVAVEDHVFHGADKRCPACDTANAAIAKHCVACGAPMDGAQEVRRREDQGAGGQDSAQQALAEHAQAKDDREAQRISKQTRKIAGQGARGLSGVPLLGLVGLPGLLVAGVLVVVAVCCGLFFYSTPTTVTVADHRWERSIPVEALMEVSEEAWRDRLPSDARGVSCRQAVRDTKQIPDGQDCDTVRVDNGDGTFSEKQKCTTRYREEDIMGEMCRYTVDRWRVVRTERAGGGLQDPPVWPAASARSGERLGQQFESYEVSYRSEDGHTDWCSTSYERWAKTALGSRWSGSRSLLGNLDCGSLEAR